MSWVTGLHCWTGSRVVVVVVLRIKLHLRGRHVGEQLLRMVLGSV